jgi:hypothetical protein
MQKPIALIACLLFYAAFSTAAHCDPNTATEQRGKPMTVITPIFSQLVAYSLPDGFKPIFQDVKREFYIQESVLLGETVEQWTQMITVTGGKDMAAESDWSPQVLLGYISDGFKNACRETFALKGIGALKVNGYDAYLAVAGCGTLFKEDKTYSETALILAIRGSKDMYTIQWAERGPASQFPDLNMEKWRARSDLLAPIKVCARVPGEPEPYPSCLEQK